MLCPINNYEKQQANTFPPQKKTLTDNHTSDTNESFRDAGWQNSDWYKIPTLFPAGSGGWVGG